MTDPDSPIDPHLRRALAQAPDADALPPASLDAVVLAAARAQAGGRAGGRPTDARRDAPGAPGPATLSGRLRAWWRRPAAAPVFATVLLGTLVVTMWRAEPPPPASVAEPAPTAAAPPPAMASPAPAQAPPRTLSAPATAPTLQTPMSPTPSPAAAARDAAAAHEAAATRARAAAPRPAPADSPAPPVPAALAGLLKAAQDRQPSGAAAPQADADVGATGWRWRPEPALAPQPLDRRAADWLQRLSRATPGAWQRVGAAGAPDPAAYAVTFEAGDGSTVAVSVGERSIEWVDADGSVWRAVVPAGQTTPARP